MEQVLLCLVSSISAQQNTCLRTNFPRTGRWSSIFQRKPEWSRFWPSRRTFHSHSNSPLSSLPAHPHHILAARETLCRWWFIFWRKKHLPFTRTHPQHRRTRKNENFIHIANAKEFFFSLRRLLMLFFLSFLRGEKKGEKTEQFP